MEEIGLFIVPNQTRYSCEEKFVGDFFLKWLPTNKVVCKPHGMDDIKCILEFDDEPWCII